MPYETLQVASEGAAAIVRLNRPEKRNAISFLMMDELEAALTALDGDDAVRGIVLTGADGNFSAGVDLNAMRDVGTSAQFMDYMNRWRRLNEAVENHSRPIIAAIEGYCLTGGFELALACDLRVGAHGSQYGITSAKIGTVPGAGGTQRLPRIVGMSNALDILFSADFIDATQAREMGILNRLVDKGAALAKATEMVAHYATRAPLSLRYAKRAVYAGMQMPLSDAIKFEAFVVSTIYQTEDKQEGVLSFLEKRSPRFTGR
jgi:enoyl-CoA hydratase/carnithine racemase